MRRAREVLDALAQAAPPGMDITVQEDGRLRVEVDGAAVYLGEFTLLGFRPAAPVQRVKVRDLERGDALLYAGDANDLADAEWLEVTGFQTGRGRRWVDVFVRPIGFTDGSRAREFIGPYDLDDEFPAVLAEQWR